MFQFSSSLKLEPSQFKDVQASNSDCFFYSLCYLTLSSSTEDNGQGLTIYNYCWFLDCYPRGNKFECAFLDLVGADSLLSSIVIKPVTSLFQSFKLLEMYSSFWFECYLQGGMWSLILIRKELGWYLMPQIHGEGTCLRHFCFNKFPGHLSARVP